MFLHYTKFMNVKIILAALLLVVGGLLLYAASIGFHIGSGGLYNFSPTTGYIFGLTCIVVGIIVLFKRD